MYGCLNTSFIHLYIFYCSNFSKCLQSRACCSDHKDFSLKQINYTQAQNLRTFKHACHISYPLKLPRLMNYYLRKQKQNMFISVIVKVIHLLEAPMLHTSLQAYFKKRKKNVVLLYRNRTLDLTLSVNTSVDLDWNVDLFAKSSADLRNLLWINALRLLAARYFSVLIHVISKGVLSPPIRPS